MCCWAHVVSQERLAFGSHMAQESGDEKKDSVHILFFVFSFTVHFFSCVLFIRVRVFLNKRIIERTFFLSQPCFAVFFWRHSRERVFSQKQHDLTRIKMQAFWNTQPTWKRGTRLLFPIIFWWRGQIKVTPCTKIRNTHVEDSWTGCMKICNTIIYLIAILFTLNPKTWLEMGLVVVREAAMLLLLLLLLDSAESAAEGDVQMVQSGVCWLCSRKVCGIWKLTYSNDLVGTVTPDNTKS